MLYYRINLKLRNVTYMVHRGTLTFLLTLVRFASLCSSFLQFWVPPWSVHSKRNANHSQNCHWKTGWIIICRKDWVSRLPQSNVRAPTSLYMHQPHFPIFLPSTCKCFQDKLYPASHFCLCEQKHGFFPEVIDYPLFDYLTGCFEWIPPINCVKKGKVVV